MAGHNQRAHAILSASSAEAWMECGQFVLAKELYPQEASDFAAEGTQAHECAEIMLRNEFKGEKLEPDFLDKDMEDYVNDYVTYIIETFNELRAQHKDTSIFIEQRLDFSNVVPFGFGTGDCIIIGGDTLHVIDLKYGKGVAKFAEHNPQLMLYGLGALNLFGDWYNFKKVVLHIIQPRLKTFSSWETTPKELKAWAKEVKARANDILKNKNFNAKPGKEQCRFCMIRETCRARAKNFMELLNKFKKEKQ